MMTTDGAAYPRSRWVMLLALCLAMVASTTILISPAPLMGVIAADLKLNVGTATAAFIGGFSRS